MGKPSWKESPLDKTLRTMREKRIKEKEKEAAKTRKAQVDARKKKVDAEKKAKANAAKTERNIRKDLFKKLNAEIAQEKKDQAKREVESTKKMRSEKKDFKRGTQKKKFPHIKLTKTSLFDLIQRNLIVKIISLFKNDLLLRIHESGLKLLLCSGIFFEFSIILIFFSDFIWPLKIFVIII